MVIPVKFFFSTFIVFYYIRVNPVSEVQLSFCYVRYTCLP